SESSAATCASPAVSSCAVRPPPSSCWPPGRSFCMRHLLAFLLTTVPATDDMQRLLSRRNLPGASRNDHRAVTQSSVAVHSRNTASLPTVHPDRRRPDRTRPSVGG